MYTSLKARFITAKICTWLLNNNFLCLGQIKTFGKMLSDNPYRFGHLYNNCFIYNEEPYYIKYIFVSNQNEVTFVCHLIQIIIILFFFLLHLAPPTFPLLFWISIPCAFSFHFGSIEERKNNPKLFKSWAYYCYYYCSLLLPLVVCCTRREILDIHKSLFDLLFFST